MLAAIVTLIFGSGLLGAVLTSMSRPHFSLLPETSTDPCEERIADAFRTLLESGAKPVMTECTFRSDRGYGITFEIEGFIRRGK